MVWYDTSGICYILLRYSVIISRTPATDRYTDMNNYMYTRERTYVYIRTEIH